MIYVENDFYLNFKNAVKSNDEQALKVMFIDQISTLIAKQRGEILSLFQKSDIALSENPSNEQIVNKLVENIRKSAKLRAGVSFLISKNNDLLVTSDKSQRKTDVEDGEENGQEKDSEIDYQQSADTVTFIATSLGAITENLKGDSLNVFKQELIKKTNSKAPNFSGEAYFENKTTKKTSKKKNKNKKWLWIALGITAVGVGVYAYKKGVFKKSNVDINV